MADINEIEQLVDGLLAEDTEIITPQMVRVMNKLKRAQERIRPQALKAKNAGLDMDNTLKRLDTIQSKIDDFLRIYG